MEIPVSLLYRSSMACSKPAMAAPAQISLGSTGSAAKPRAIPAVQSGALWPAIILLYSLIIPPEFQLSFGSLVIYPNRIVCLFALPWLATNLGRQGLRLTIPDFLVIAFCVWMIAVSIIHHGASGIQFGGGLAFDLVVPYFIIRACVRSPEDFRRLLILFLPGVAIAAGFILFESVTHVGIVRPFARLVMGNLIQFDSLTDKPDFRWGLMRAQGPFAHPILAGLFLAGLLPLYLNIGNHHAFQRVGGMITSLFAFFSLSSVAFLLVALNGILLAFDWLQKRISMLSWKSFLFGLLSVIVALQLFTSGVSRVVINHLTFNPQTGYYRLLIWEYGTASVRAHPWIGIGKAEYVRLFWMPSTVDHNWLLIAIRFGLPGAMLFYAAIVIAVWNLSRAVQKSRGITREIRIALVFTLASLVTAGFTVAFFGTFSIFFAMLVAVAVSISAPIPQSSSQPPADR